MVEALWEGERLGEEAVSMRGWKVGAGGVELEPARGGEA